MWNLNEVGDERGHESQHVGMGKVLSFESDSKIRGVAGKCLTLRFKSRSETRSSQESRECCMFRKMIAGTPTTNKMIAPHNKCRVYDAIVVITQMVGNTCSYVVSNEGVVGMMWCAG